MSSGREILFSSPVYTRSMKRQFPHVLNGISNTFEDKTNDFLCPICFEIIEEAHITRCGHTFCYRCIMKALEMNTRCPKCSFVLSSSSDTFPNFLLNELISKYKSRIKLAHESGLLNNPSSDGTQVIADGLRELISLESQSFSLLDVNIMLETLKKRKLHLEAESCVTQNRLLYDFLKNLLKVKEIQLCDITKEVSVIKKDIEEVETILNTVDTTNDMQIEFNEHVGSSEEILSKKEAVVPERNDLDRTESFNSMHKHTDITQSSFILRSKIIQTHFDDFVKCYFTCRAKEITFGKTDKNLSLTDNSHSNNSGLEVFRENLVKFSRYSKLRPIATLNYSNDIYNNSTIVSSIEFDRDNEFFAIAGVTKRIKVYDYDVVTRDIVDVHYPACEIVSTSKISCITWNSYLKSTLASSDYEGAVTLWDTAVAQRIKTFQEHEKRCWSVDFNNVDTRLIASGSDDARVKLWSVNLEHSVATLEAKANVCCVKFNPRSSCHLAFGSADHCVHYYDLRNMKQALAIFKGHRKAVSYVKFLNHEEIVSASTDSQLKLWNVNASHCLRSFVGHVNEKNFVGLATDGDYIACGSENNALYIYYKGLSKQLLSCKFDIARSVLEKEQKEDDINEFVSAVCWRQISSVVVAANSQGIIKVLELI